MFFGQLVTTKLRSSKRFPTHLHSFKGLPSAWAAQCRISKGNYIGLNDENTLSPFSEPTLGNRSDKWGHRHFSSGAQHKLSPEQGGPTGSQECRIASAVGQCLGLSEMASEAPPMPENLWAVNSCVKAWQTSDLVVKPLVRCPRS